MVKGLTLTGTEKKIEVSGGLHVFVMNFSTDTELLVSKTPNAVKGKEGTYVIAPKTGIMVQDTCTMGTIEGVSDYRGELYAKGNGYAQFVPTNSLNFSVVGGGGDSSSPTPVIENPLHIKGIVATVEDLPDTGEVGDMYFVGNPDTDEDLAEYVYIGNKFEKLGTVSKDKDLVGILGRLVETVGYEHNNYIAPDGVTFANYEMYSFHEEIEPDLVLAKNGGMSNLYTRGELTNAFAVTHYVNSNLTLDRNVEEMHLIADYDVTSNTTADEAIVSMTYTCIDEDGDEALDSLIFPIDLTNKGGTSRAGIKLPEDAIGVEENVVALQVNGTHEFDITLRLNLIKVPKGTEIDYDTYEWREPTWSVSTSLNDILVYMHNEMNDEITDRVLADITPRLEDLRDDLDNVIDYVREFKDEIPNKADKTEIIADNLIPTPYFIPSGYTTGGVTYSYDDNYVFTVNSESSASANGYCSLVDPTIGIPNLVNGETYTYYATNGSDNSEVKIRCYYYNTATKTERAIDNAFVNNPLTFTYSPNENEVLGLQLYTLKGARPVNEVITVMLEKGEKPHSYQLYNLSRQSLRKDIDELKSKGTILERVQNTTRVVTAPEKSTFASVSKIEGKTVKCRNLNDTNKATSVSFTITDNYISNIRTDTRTAFMLFAYIGTSTTSTRVIKEDIVPVGKHSYSFTATENADKLIVRHNGYVADLSYEVPVKIAMGRTYTLSMNVISNNPTVVDGLKISEIQLEEGSIATEYEPYFDGLHSAPVENIVIVGRNRIINTIKHSSINTDGSLYSSIATTNYDTHIVKVVAEQTYSFTKGTDTYVYAFYNSYPNIGDISYDGSRIVGGNGTVTAPINGYLCFRSTADFKANCEIGDSVSDIPEPYTETTISLADIVKNLPDYGCSVGDVSNYVDLENMKYYHNSTVVNLEDATWSSLSSPGGILFKTTVFAPVKNPTDFLMCPPYRYIKDYTTFYSDPVSAVSSADGYIYIRDLSCSTLSELQEVIKGIKIAYELATPEVIDLKTIIPPIAVTPNGTLTFNNEHNLDIPTEVIYKKEG